MCSFNHRGPYPQIEGDARDARDVWDGIMAAEVAMETQDLAISARVNMYMGLRCMEGWFGQKDTG